MRWTLRIVGAVFALLLAAPPASAEIQEHLIVDPAPDMETVTTSFTEALAELGMAAAPHHDETRSVNHEGTDLTFRHIEYYVPTPQGGQITATFFMLVDPDPDALEALDAYLTYNYGFSASTMLRIRDLGTLNWYEWSPTGVSYRETLDKELGDWRDRFIDIP